MRLRTTGRVIAVRQLLLFLGVIPFLALIAAAPAVADKRIALVIGNSAYQNVARLDNPRNDAKLMADTLRNLGFTLIGGSAQLDVDKATFDSAVQKFSSQIQGADVGLFYYAGHGVQVRGSNYLVPVGANPTREADVDFQMVDIALVLRQMEGSGTKLNLVILDACRNNPFGGRGLRATEGGLAQMRAPEGTLISYATQPGNVAQDGADGNSPYTRALARTISQPGRSIFETFNDVGLAVMQATANAQQPWLSSSPIKGNFYFSAVPAGSALPQVATAAIVPPTTLKDVRLTDPADPLRLHLVTDCDRLAASPNDAQRSRSIGGVLGTAIDVVPALAACNEAMRQYPDVARFFYQAARVAVVQKDYTRARQLLETAIGLGSAIGMSGLGNFYVHGLGVPKDYGEARKWYAKAAEQNQPDAMDGLGFLYQQGWGVPKDYGEARKWYAKAAEQNQPEAMAGLGGLYEQGWGVPKDYFEARKWYTKAAEQNQPVAMVGLGDLYAQGWGVPKDYGEARKWYTKAADLGNPLGLYGLGLLYEQGWGVPKDYTEARKWYTKAAAAGNDVAKARLRNLK